MDVTMEALRFVLAPLYRVEREELRRGSESAFRCLVCGDHIEEPLSRLGSTRCLECRLDGGGNGHATVEVARAPVRLRIRVSEPALVDDLVGFFRRRQCLAHRVDGRVIEVQPHPTLREEHARAELDLLLGVWQAGHPGSRATCIG
jgi:hypothetical protein